MRIPKNWTNLEVADRATSRVRTVGIEEIEAPRLCVFLDGEFYLERMDLPAVLAELRTEGFMTNVRCVAVPFETMQNRLADYSCNDAFNRFLASDLLPAIETSAPTQTQPHIIVGLSLSSLGSLYAAMRRGDLFSTCIAQSPSVWWRNEWLKHEAGKLRLDGHRFWLSVGSEETDIDEGESDDPLHQTVSQLDSTRNLAAALERAGAEVTVRVFDGDHEIRHWATDLPLALRWACQSS